MNALIVETGTANLASVVAGLRRAGASPELCSDPARVRTAPRVVLPGVGALGAAMERLGASGLAEALAERIRAGRPTLAVCLGLQLLCQGSEESPGVPGLGVLPGQARRFPGTVVAPQMGWNRIAPDPGCALLEAGHAYFANSFRLTEAPPGWGVAWAEHGGPFVAACERGPLLACQFHPELSGAFGLCLLARWLRSAGRLAALPGGA